MGYTASDGTLMVNDEL